MSHGPATDWGEDKAIGYKTKLGVILFLVYVAVYTGFIVVNVASPKAMETIIFSGLNLAVVYGFGLIVLAFIMGVIYNHFCTKKENEMEGTDK